MTTTALDCKARFDTMVETISDIPDAPPPHTRDLTCAWGDQEACRRDNVLRATWAGAALKEFVANVGEDVPDATISDLLADLMHLCDALDVDFDEALRRGRNAYEPESEGRW